MPGWQSCTDEGSFTRAILNALAEEFHFTLDVPFESYSKEIHDILINGTNKSVRCVTRDSAEKACMILYLRA